MLSSMFENIDINYIVIGLIVLTLVCIYLLYNSLNSSSDSLELKKHINELVLQNKKRDEIIHFLVSQVQLLQSQPPITEITTNENNNQLNETVNPDENVDINTEEMTKLDELLETDFTTTEVEVLSNKEEKDTSINQTTLNTNNEENNHTTLDTPNEEIKKEEETLIDEVLSNDKLPPKDKDLLYVYTVSQLKDYAKELNISTGGTKDILINRIYNSL
jgi:hypothetical protein